MFSHVTLGSNDFAKAERFYDAVMAVLGHPVMFKAPGNVLAYGTPAGEKLFIVRPFDQKEARPGNGVHAAFKVEKRATVDAFLLRRLCARSRRQQDSGRVPPLERLKPGSA